MSAITCPTWCTGEHAFVNEHDGHGHGSSERVCIVAGANFGDETEPKILIMLGDLPGMMSVRIPPHDARVLVKCLEDPATGADIVASLKAALAEVAR